jgi:SAM-dependent methyltransferase
MKQREVFLQTEGDAWFERNTGRLDARYEPASDRLLTEVMALVPPGSSGARTRILEIGCGNGERLAWLRDNQHCECFGIEPSQRATADALSRGLDVRQGTADQLPFSDASFDVVVYGFCLYLCDREDLFRIACEGDRVLSDPGWLLLQDFYGRTSSRRAYHHRTGLFSHKMDYTSLFSWHPAYSVYSHRLSPHGGRGYTDDPGEWVATSVLRKNLCGGIPDAT